MRNSSPRSGNKPRRVSLKNYKEEIRSWVAQGHTDEWIASYLGTSPASVQSFRSRNDIMRRHQALPEFEAVLDRGEEEGWGLWLDPQIADNPAFKRVFNGVRDLRVRITTSGLVIEPAEADEDSGNELAAYSGLNAPSDGESPDYATRESEVEAASKASDGISFSDPSAGKDFEKSTPDKGASESGRLEGTLKFTAPERGFGFIVASDEDSEYIASRAADKKRPPSQLRDVFFHLPDADIPDDAEAGTRVSYRLEEGKKGLQAVDVRLLR